MPQIAILPSNRERQKEIISEIITLQQKDCDVSRLENLQTELDELMVERSEAKKVLAMNRTIEEITGGIEFEEFHTGHFKRLKDSGLKIPDISRYYGKTDIQVYNYLSVLGIFKKAK